jgi:hypothetical protein
MFEKGCKMNSSIVPLLPKSEERWSTKAREAAESFLLIRCQKKSPEERQKDVKKAVALLVRNPKLLRCIVEVSDEQRRIIKGTPLKIAIMAREVRCSYTAKGIFKFKRKKHLQPYLQEMGIVESLIIKSDLSLQEIRDQLSVITSDEAKKENERRNNRILTAVKLAWYSLFNDIESKALSSEIKSEKENGAFLKVKERMIEQLIKESLKHPKEDVIQSGFIFDPRVITQIFYFFNEQLRILSNKKLSEIVYSMANLFFVKTIGKMQKMLSKRDLEAYYYGLSDFIEKRPALSRQFNYEDSYRGEVRMLGSDYCLGSACQKISDTFSSKSFFENGNVRFSTEFCWSFDQRLCEITENKFFEYRDYINNILNPQEKTPEQWIEELKQQNINLAKEKESEIKELNARLSDKEARIKYLENELNKLKQPSSLLAAIPPQVSASEDQVIVPSKALEEKKEVVSKAPQKQAESHYSFLNQMNQDKNDHLIRPFDGDDLTYFHTDESACRIL